MNSINYALGFTGNFLAVMLRARDMQNDYPIFETCLDATDYVPTGAMSDTSGRPVINSIFVR
jgi:hypothetical protein